jgi:SAM-dependent methyltransferase
MPQRPADGLEIGLVSRMSESSPCDPSPGDSLVPYDHSNVEDITRATYDRIAIDYCRTTASYPTCRALATSARVLATWLSPKSRVLILGAGDGRDATTFLELGHIPVLLDFSIAMLTIARQRHPLCHIVLADMRCLPFSAELFDAVWASTCIYHIRKQFLLTLFDEVFRVLRPKGLLYFNTRKGTGQLLDSRPRSYPRGGSRFYAFYHLSELQPVVRSFEVLRFEELDVILGDYYQFWLRKKEVH